MASKDYLRFKGSVVSWRDVIYIKLDDLGSGGSSRVYKVLATSGPRRGMTFAVKMFNAVGKEGWQRNFMREVHVLRDCDHPAIVKVYDEGMYLDQFPFVVMEYFPRKLSQVLPANELSEKDKFNVVMQLLSALNYLSRRDPPIVHRDIKPTNIFLKKDSCVLGDFGLILQDGANSSSRVASDKSTPQKPAVTKNYRTPELVKYRNEGTKPGPASDVFQLGLVSTEMFTGENPLSSGPPDPPVKISSIASIGGQFGDFIKRLLEQMLILEIPERPTAAVMLGQWQELFLDLCQSERETAEFVKRKAGESVSPESTPPG